MNITEYLERLELKISQLALKMQQINRMNDTLVRENQQLQLELLDKNKQLALLQKQLVEVNHQTTLREQEGLQKVAELKLSLEQATRQVDACIKWLSTH